MPELEVFALGEDELEALRLCDLEGFDQESAGERMGVSRGTVQRLLKSARATLVRAIVENGAVVIGARERPSGGPVDTAAESDNLQSPAAEKKDG